MKQTIFSIYGYFANYFFFSVKFDHMPDLLNYGDILFHLLYYIEMYILFALGEAEIQVNVWYSTRWMIHGKDIFANNTCQNEPSFCKKERLRKGELPLNKIINHL